MAVEARVRPIRRWLPDVNPANVSAGITCGLWYVFGGLPIFLGTAASLRLTPAETSSWLFITCLSGAICGVFLTLRYRQPLAVTMTIPGWVFLATVGPHYGYAAIVGANIVAGCLILVAGLLGLGSRLMSWLPLPIVMGMFAGSIVGYVIGVFTQLGLQPLLVAPVLIAYLGARAVDRSWLPPLAAAAAAGLIAATVLGKVHIAELRWMPPVILLPRPAFTAADILALSLPLAVMTIGIGNVQGFGMLLNKGYRPPINLSTVLVGVASIVNGIFGGHPATVARNGIAIVAADDAGPRDQRYIANLVATGFLILLAAGASMARPLLSVLPPPLVAVLAGIAILGALHDALRRTVAAELPLGAFFAFGIAASPLQFLGIGSAFWALVGGLLASLVVERRALLHLVRASADRQRKRSSGLC